MKKSERNYSGYFFLASIIRLRYSVVDTQNPDLYLRRDSIRDQIILNDNKLHYGVENCVKCSTFKWFI